MTALPPNTPPLMLTRPQAAAYCGIGVDLFDDLVRERVLPEPVRLGKKAVRWDRRRIMAAFDRLQGLEPVLRAGLEKDDILEALDNA